MKKARHLYAIEWVGRVPKSGFKEITRYDNLLGRLYVHRFAHKGCRDAFVMGGIPGEREIVTSGMLSGRGYLPSTLDFRRINNRCCQWRCVTVARSTSRRAFPTTTQSGAVCPDCGRHTSCVELLMGRSSCPVCARGGLRSDISDDAEVVIDMGLARGIQEIKRTYGVGYKTAIARVELAITAIVLAGRADELKRG
jgi:hypothetical protein